MRSKWRMRIEQQLTQAWLQQRSLLSIALLPIASIYSIFAAIRCWFFKIGLRTSTRLPVKVVVIGNVVAGGAGKTPTAIAISQRLTSDGYRVGVISRGYGRKNTQIQEVFPHSTASEVGDEPLLMQKKLNLPMFVGSNRVAAALQLLQKYPQVDTLVCDDGIQHLQLFRDVEVYVFDNRGVGNGLPLPSGPLRSPWPPIYIAQIGQSTARTIVLHTGSKPVFAGHHAHRELAPWGIRSDGTAVALSELQRGPKRIIAIAGIAQPQVFFKMLTTVGFHPAHQFSYPDHYDFTDWTPPSASEYTVLCTEKDAVKIWPRMPSAIALPLVQTMDEAFFRDIRVALQKPPPSSTRYH